LDNSPDADARLKQLFKVVCDIEAHSSFGGGERAWSSIVNIADENRHNFYKALNGKTLFSALHGTHTVALEESEALLKASSPTSKSETTKSAASQ
jgi:hypothetical protein